MNRRERRYGRMYLLPLLLALSGLAVLVLEWVLRLEGFDVFDELKQTLLRNSVSLIYPVVLLFLYVFRISPKTARVFSIVSLVLLLTQLILVIYCMTHQAQGLILWIPGHMLLRNIKNLQLLRNARNVLLTFADACFVLSSLSAVFNCLIYAFVKTRSEARNAEFDRKNAYLTHGLEKSSRRTEKDNAPATDEPTRVVSVPEEFSESEH